MDLKEIFNQLEEYLQNLDQSTLRRFYNERLDDADVVTLGRIQLVSDHLSLEAGRLIKTGPNRIPVNQSKDSSDEAVDERPRSMAKRGRRMIEPSSSPKRSDTSSHTNWKEEDNPTPRDKTKGKTDKKVKREQSQDPGRGQPTSSTVKQETKSKPRPEQGSKPKGRSQNDEEEKKVKAGGQPSRKSTTGGVAWPYSTDGSRRQ